MDHIHKFIRLKVLLCKVSLKILSSGLCSAGMETFMNGHSMYVFYLNLSCQAMLFPTHAILFLQAEQIFW